MEPLRVVANQLDVNTEQDPRDNRLIRLASSLSAANPAIQQALRGVAQRSLDKQSRQAAEDVLRTGGAQAFGDAQREGIIAPTQNPFYIDAYERERGAALGRRSVSQLSIDATSWPERNDPAAFQERWSSEIASIQDQFPTRAGKIGLEAPVREITQQVLASNLATNSDRIQKEREVNARTIATDQVNAASDAPGAINPATLVESFSAQQADYIRNGGTAEQFEQVYLEGVIASAYTKSDSSILDILAAPGSNGRPLMSLPGVAERVSQDRYRIEQAADNARQDAIRAEREKKAAEASKAEALLYETYGEDVLLGRFDRDAATAMLRAQGLAPEAISDAYGQLRKTLADNRSLGEATYDPEGAEGKVVLDLYKRALRIGYSDEWYTELMTEVASGRMDEAEARSYLSAAISQQEQLQRKAAARKASSGTKPKYSGQGYDLSTVAKARTALNDLLAATSSQASAMQLRGVLNTPERQAQFKQRLTGAFSQVLSAGGTPAQGYEAAQLDAEIYIAEMQAAKAARDLSPATTPTRPGSRN